MATEQTMTADGYYANDLRHTAVGQYLFEQEWAFITDVFHPTRSDTKTLEIACGSGRITESLRASGVNVIGVDLNLVSLRHLQRRVGNVPTLQVRVPALPFHAETFETIIACECLDYFDHRMFFAECYRLLRPDGMIIFDSLNRRSYKWLLKGLVGRRLNLPSSELTYQQVIADLKTAGFTIESVRGYNWQPFFRDSDTPLVGVAAQVEELLQCGRWYQVSPKILVAAVKGGHNRSNPQ
jgi:2-polyprenyl-3-methyl-5-hydroxy-6-metoxy-1,4-benzoquinol methylase